MLARKPTHGEMQTPKSYRPDRDHASHHDLSHTESADGVGEARLHQGHGLDVKQPVDGSAFRSQGQDRIENRKGRGRTKAYRGSKIVKVGGLEWYPDRGEHGLESITEDCVSGRDVIAVVTFVVSLEKYRPSEARTGLARAYERC